MFSLLALCMVLSPAIGFESQASKSINKNNNISLKKQTNKQPTSVFLKRRQKNPWGLLSSQPSQNCELRMPMRDPASKTNDGGSCLRLISDLYMHAYICVCRHTHTYTRTQIPHFKMHTCIWCKINKEMPRREKRVNWLVFYPLYNDTWGLVRSMRQEGNTELRMHDYAKSD